MNSLRNLKNKNRITYIDSLRSVAILMVLEGHFITQSLQTQYKDDHNSIYSVWKFARCLTAPTFLFISGLIFTYLLLKNKNVGFKNTRLQKGFIRSLKLISFGYLLQFNLYSYFVLNKPLFTDLFQIFHILQCIGASLFIVMMLYILKTYANFLRLGVLTAFMGFLFFAGSPTIHQTDLSNLPQYLENALIISKNYNEPSIFPLFHWAGFVMFGATLGTIFHQNKKLIHSYSLPVLLCSTGIVLVYTYHYILHFLYTLLNTSKIIDFSYVFEFKRLGQILVGIGIFIFIHKLSPKIKPAFKYIPWNQDLFIKIGQNTLSIFILHVIILYRGFFGWKINELTSKKLSPYPSILGAILFIVFFVLWVYYLESIQKIIKKGFNYFIQKITHLFTLKFWITKSSKTA